MNIINPLGICPKATIDEALRVLDKNCNIEFQSKKQYQRYKIAVIKQFEKVIEEFPLMKIVHRQKQASYIFGYNIKKEDLDYTLMDEKYFRSFGMCIFGYIPPFDPSFDVKAVEIYDIYNCINYSYLSTLLICHLDNVNNYPFVHICTNKSVEITINNFLYTPVAVSLRLYMEYRNVDNGGEFRIDCHPHGGSY